MAAEVPGDDPAELAQATHDALHTLLPPGAGESVCHDEGKVPIPWQVDGRDEHFIARAQHRVNRAAVPTGLTALMPLHGCHPLPQRVPQRFSGQHSGAK